MDKQKLLYAIVREIDKGNKSFTHEDLDMEREIFEDTIRLASREGYITGVYYADDRPFYERAKATMKGLEYLKENSGWAKTYRGLKELRDWLK